MAAIGKPAFLGRWGTRRSAMYVSTCLIVALLRSPLAFATPTSTQWGPDRPAFDYANGTSVGSLDQVVFNSYSNTPGFGDERNFVGIDKNNSNTWDKSVDVKPGDTIRIRAYIDNNANPAANGDNFNGSGVARNARIRFYIPKTEGNDINVAGYISAGNAVPRRVYNTAEVTSAQTVRLEYIPGSAVLHNYAPLSRPLPDDIVGGTGTLLGYKALDGVFPADFDYSAVVIISIKIMASSSVLHNYQILTSKLTTEQQGLLAVAGITVVGLLPRLHPASHRRR